MLTSVLHTEKAVEASILIIEAFVDMSHYLRQNVQLLPYQEIQRLESMQLKTEAKVNRIEEKMITREDLSDLMKLFDQEITNEEILILDGQPFKADIAYQQIYRKAKKKITVIDDYISVKTLQQLAVAKDSTTITIISDNKGRFPLIYLRNLTRCAIIPSVSRHYDQRKDETTMPRTKKNPEVTEEVKAEKPVKAAAAKVKAAAKKPAAKAKAAKLEIFIQSPMGGNITPEEIAAKLPKGAKSVFVRVDQNKLWWINGEETGSVDIW